MVKSLLAAIVSAVTLAGPQLDHSVANAGFEDWAGTGPPIGWTFTPLTGANTYALTRTAGESGYGARLTTNNAATAALLSQQVDATPWRGKDIEFSARVRIEGDARVALTIAVLRPEPNSFGTHDQSGAPDAARGGWTTIRKFAHVDEDALTLDVGLGVAGGGTVSLDDYVIREARLPDAPTNPVAAAYIDAALAQMRKEHLRRHELDWPTIEARAHREIAGAQSPRDTYWVIRGLLGTLGDHHSMFIPPAPPQSAGELRRQAATPQVRLVAHRFGVVTLPGVDSWGPTGSADTVRYVQVGQEGLKRLDRHALCGWVIDLRSDTGGDMWPMLNSISPLLGRPPFSSVMTPDGPASEATISTAGRVVEAPVGSKLGLAKPGLHLRQSSLPVAVLTSERTRSAGESVVISLAGRPRSRRFGEPTAGFTSANSGEDMADGALLAIATGWSRDRLGREYKERIDPDEKTTADAALSAATSWLAKQCSRPGLNPDA